MDVRLLWAIVLCSTLALSTQARPPLPEGPSGAASCDESTGDEDLNNLANAADPKCAAPPALTQIRATGVYAAEAESGILAGTLVAVVRDPLEPFGPGKDYIWVPPGQNPFRGQAVYAGAPPGTYEVHILARFESPSSAEVWLKADTQPFHGPPSNADADILNNRSALLSPTWLQLGRTGSGPNYVAGIKSEPRRQLKIDAGQSVYLMAQAGLQIDCIALRPINNTEPINCPGEDRGGGGTPNYLVEQWSTAPTVDGVEDAMWAQAPAVPFTGTGSTAGSSILRVLWKEAGPDRICYFLKHTHPDLTATTTSEDDTAIFSDTALDVRTHYVDLQRVRDQHTYAFVVNGATPTPTIYDRNDAGGASNPPFNFGNRSAAATYAAGVLIIEACHDVPSNVSAGQQFLADVGINERQSGHALRYKLAHCTGTNLIDPACWGVWSFASTVIDRPPDTSAPRVGPPSCTPNESGAVCVSAIVETESLPVTCRAFRDADHDNEVTADSEFRTTSCGTTVGGNCTCSYTGLTLPDHEVQIEATDAAGNVGVSSVARFSLTTPSGDTFYIAPKGEGDNGHSCTAPDKPCANLAGILAKTDFGPGDTIRVLNGTHTTGFMLNCGDNPSKFNGTPALRITLRAENERQAHIIPTNALDVPLSFQNCSHWTIEGLYFQGMDSSLPGSMTSPVNFSRSGTNIIFRRNVVKHNNQCKNSAIFRVEHVTDSLFEDNEFLDFHRNGVGAGQRNLYRRNHIHSRGANSPTCFTGDGSHDRTRGDSAAIVYAGQPNHDMLWENNLAENSESGFVVTGGIFHKRNKFYGNIARLTTNAGFHEEARKSGFKEDSYYEHNLSLGHRATGFRCRGSVGVVYRNNSAIAINMGLGLGKPGFSCDVTIDGWGNQNYNWTLIQNLSLGHSDGTGIIIEHPVSNKRTGNVSNWELRKNNSFGHRANYSPASGGTSADGNGTSTGIFTGNTTVNPALGDALICIPSTSPMHPTQRADGLQVGASILYRYESPNALQPGNLTRQPLWSTSKGAGSNCPNSVSGWYPSWLRPCIAGVNDIAGQSLYDIADRVISRNPATVTSVLNSCVVGGSYP